MIVTPKENKTEETNMKARLLKKLLNNTRYSISNHDEYIAVGSPLCHDLISVDKTQPEAKIANLWIAVMMNEMKPRSVIPIVKKAFIGGFQSRDKEITSLRAENERLKKQIEWLEKEYQNKAH